MFFHSLYEVSIEFGRTVFLKMMLGGGGGGMAERGDKKISGRESTMDDAMIVVKACNVLFENY